MDKFQIEVYMKSKTEIFTTPESFVTLFVYNYLNCPTNIQLEIVQRDSPPKGNSKLRLNISYLNNNRLFSSKSFNCKFKDTTDEKGRLPMYQKDNLFIFGVCSICRTIVLQANRADLLGFKKSCLLAPTEKSIWTKLCEIDMIIAIQEIVKHIEDNKNEILIPNCYTVFENHMSQPVRAHNFYKLVRENFPTKTKTSTIEPLENFKLEHNFAEGYFFSLVDVILYPCILLLFIINKNKDTFQNSFPLIYTWIKKVEDFDENLLNNFEKLIHTKFYRDFGKELRFLKSENRLINSLYKNDKINVHDKLFTNQRNIDFCLQKISSLNLHIESKHIVPEELLFDWEKIPKLAHPEFGGLPKQRVTRKKHQLRNLADFVISLAKPNDIIVDFCSGTGHLGIILAISLPQCHIIFLENKSISVLKAKERAEKLNLKNCSFFQSNIDYFEMKFDIGVSLHACGTATDIVLWKCIQVRAKFICCPCCYGSISPMPHIHYPLSQLFNSAIDEDNYLYIAHAADQSHDISVKNCNIEKRKQGELCMDIIDTDRKYLAEEKGYTVLLKKLYPENCTPKNRLLIGYLKAE